MTDLVRLEHSGHVAAVTLDQPQTRKAISDREMVDAIAREKRRPVFEGR